MHASLNTITAIHSQLNSPDGRTLQPEQPTPKIRLSLTFPVVVLGFAGKWSSSCSQRTRDSPAQLMWAHFLKAARPFPHCTAVDAFINKNWKHTPMVPAPLSLHLTVMRDRCAHLRMWHINIWSPTHNTGLKCGQTFPLGWARTLHNNAAVQIQWYEEERYASL